jgi:hypothetical protein
MADHYHRIIEAADAMDRLAPRAPDPIVSVHEVLVLASRIRVRGKALKRKAPELSPSVIEKIDRLHAALSREDVREAFGFGRILFDALPGIENPKPKRPY